MACDLTDFVDKEIENIATQYRESPNLLALIRVYLDQLVDVFEKTCAIPDFFDIDSSTGDQLTIIGKWLGWPREHCAGRKLPIFGFTCNPPQCSNRSKIITGFCEAGIWECDSNPGFGDYVFTDDELYRRFLKSMIIKLDKDYRRPALIEAAGELFGSNASIYHERPGHVYVDTGRLLTNEEISIAHLYQNVLPIPPGVAVRIYESDALPFGFGQRWGGLCTGKFPTLINDGVN